MENVKNTLLALSLIFGIVSLFAISCVILSVESLLPKIAKYDVLLDEVESGFALVYMRERVEGWKAEAIESAINDCRTMLARHPEMTDYVLANGGCLPLVKRELEQMYGATFIDQGKRQ